MKYISLLGATGSIGTQTVDIILNNKEEFSLVAMSVGKNISVARKIIKELAPEFVSTMTKEDSDMLQAEYPNITFSYGEHGLINTATYEKADILVNGIMGSIGLKPTMLAIEAKKDIALANKETLVTAGHIVMDAVKKYGVRLLPVDSEHSAIFQSLQGENSKNIERIILTASGGSFRDRTRDELKNVTVKEALNHPNWSMGAKITIDSASMMNKGLEVIEAHWLFDLPYEKIDVLLHKESVIHSMVEFHDSSVIAQLGSPDMRVPIQYALTYPDRLHFPSAKRLNLAEIGKLHFQEINFDRFRCLKFAFMAGREGGSYPTVLNAANEMAVDAFLNGQITFLQIEDCVEEALNQHKKISNPCLSEIDIIDKETRHFVQTLIHTTCFS